MLATLGTAYGLLDAEGRSLILAAAMITIMLNPAAFALAGRLAGPEPRQPVAAQPEGHVVLVGFGRVGKLVGESLVSAGAPVTIIETEGDVGLPTAPNARTLIGNASDPDLLKAAEIDDAKVLLIAIPETFEAGQIVEQARRANPKLTIIARAHSDDEVVYLEQKGATRTIMGEREIADRMISEARRA
jgi:CPA2 family monovalent cation:H+ antiporter-2